MGHFFRVYYDLNISSFRTEQNFTAYKMQAARKRCKSMHVHVNRRTFRDKAKKVSSVLLEKFSICIIVKLTMNSPCDKFYTSIT